MQPYAVEGAPATGGTRERILLAALALFARDGYEAVPVSRIAGALGMTKGALYKHYTNKRDIFESIVRRMEEMDREQARQYEMPEGTLTQMAQRYSDTSLETIRAYTEAQFCHWTQTAFFANFRKMLTLEQYRDPEMAALYQQYLAGGPLGYVADLFRAMGMKEAEARQRALDYYAPMYLFYSLYDGGMDAETLTAMLRDHICRFAEKLALDHPERKAQ